MKPCSHCQTEFEPDIISPVHCFCPKCEEAIEKWQEENDGQPDEPQEWRDYDPDC